MQKQQPPLPDIFTSPSNHRYKLNSARHQSNLPAGELFLFFSRFHTPLQRSNPQTSTMMHMTFYWGKSVTILFDSWNPSTWPAYLLTLLAVFLFSAFYQYLEDRRLKFKATYASKPQISAGSSIQSPLLPQSVQHRKIAERCVEAVLFGVNSALGYMLMLAVMSFNGGVFLAVVFGLLSGYLVFRSHGMGSEEKSCACA